jgi:hypothetical protein
MGTMQVDNITNGSKRPPMRPIKDLFLGRVEELEPKYRDRSKLDRKEISCLHLIWLTLQLNERLAGLIQTPRNHL